ncbi:MAG: hypothetical protein ACOCRX_12260 [Candidatus Woesearchaeota archaeon]
MNSNGLTKEELKTFNDLLLKSNDYQLVLLLDSVRTEQKRRVYKLKEKYKM